MGACVQKSSKSKVNYMEQLRKQPEDTEFYNPKYNENLPTLKFQGSLKNVKLEGEIEKSHGITFEITDRMMKAQFPSLGPFDQKKRTIQWQTKEEFFLFYANDYKIRKSILSITVYTQKNLAIESFQINLFKVLTGPKKHCFKLKSSEGKHMRLFFDLKITQIIKVEAQIHRMALDLFNESTLQKFNFTLQSITSESGKKLKKVATKPSETKTIIQTEESLILQILDEQEAPVCINDIKKNLKPENKQQESKKLEWIGEQSLPQLSLNMKANEINHTKFIFHFWRVLVNKQIRQNKQVMHKYGNHQINFHQLIEKIKTCIQEESGKSYSSKLEIAQNIMSNGQIKGSFKAEIKIKIPKFIQQLYGWIRTQNGVLNGEFSSLQNDQDEATPLQSFQKIQELHQRLTSIRQEITGMALNYEQKKTRNKQKGDIIQDLSRNIKMFGSDAHIENYCEEESKKLLKKQLILLKIFHSLHSLLQQKDCQDTEQYWRVILLLLRRPQFQLKHIGFNRQSFKRDECNYQNLNENCSHFGKQNHKLIKKKLKRALQFKKLLFNSLILSLQQNSSLQDKFYKVSSCQIFRAYCFVRIPLFRQYLINEIYSQTQFGDIDFQLNRPKNDTARIDSRSLHSLQDLQWNNTFYQVLNIYPESKELDQKLHFELQRSVWIDQIHKKDTEFFRFFRITVQKLEYLKNKIKTNIQYFSGYNKLAFSFMKQLKRTQLIYISDSLLKSSMVLLNNEDFHEDILQSIALKTNIFDSNLVLKCIQIYRKYILYLTRNQKFLNSSFCYGVFIKVFKKIISIDSINCVAALLMLVYEIYDKLQMEFQSYLTCFLLGCQFVRLFYHWSYLVRSIFHHIFILKISQNRFIFYPTSSKFHIKLSQVYDNSIKKLHEIQKQIKQQSKAYRSDVQRSYYLKMKSKLQTRRKLVQTVNQVRQRKVNKNTLSKMKPQSIQKQNKNGQSSLEIFDILKREDILSNKPKQNDSSILMKSTTLLSQDEIPAQIPSLKFKKKQYTYHQSVKYHGAFRQNEFIVSKLTQIQKNHRKISHQEFAKINYEIKKEFIETQILPQIPLNKDMILDSKDVEIQAIDFF